MWESWSLGLSSYIFSVNPEIQSGFQSQVHFFNLRAPAAPDMLYVNPNKFSVACYSPPCITVP